MAAGSKIMDLPRSEIDRLEEVIPTVNIELVSHVIYEPKTGKHFNKSPREIEEINAKFRNYERQRDQRQPEPQKGDIGLTIQEPEQVRDIDRTYCFLSDSQSSESSVSLYLSFCSID